MITRTDVERMRASGDDPAVARDVMRKAPDPSVTVLVGADRSCTAVVVVGGRFKEVADVIFIDMGGPT